MRLTRWLGHPTRVVPAAYLMAIAVGTTLLMLPAATAEGSDTTLLQASFTAVSAICITGLTVVDTAVHWSPVGQFIILGLIQVGGFGIVTLASFLTLMATGRLSLQSTAVARLELRGSGIGSVLRVPTMIAKLMLAVEAVVALILTFAFRPYTDGWSSAVWHGVFHSVSAFNNAGFALFSDSLMGFAGDPAVILPICAAVVLGGLGFPLVMEFGRRFRRRIRHQARPAWSVHARLTIVGTVVLLVVGALVFAIAEWNNPQTLAPMSAGERALTILGGSIFPRTAGFNAIDYGMASESTIGLYYVLMFIGGGSVGTAGGVKVGTVGIIFAAVIAELRAETQVVVGRRALPRNVIRGALTVVVLGGLAVVAGTFFIVADDRFSLQETLFEAVSAFGTVGLSTGITPQLRPESLVVLMLLMYLGRVGTVSVASALAMRARHRRYVLPEEQPIVG